MRHARQAGSSGMPAATEQSIEHVRMYLIVAIASFQRRSPWLEATLQEPGSLAGRIVPLDLYFLTKKSCKN